MTSPRDIAFEFIERSNAVEDVSSLLANLSYSVGIFGFRHLALVGLPDDVNRRGTVQLMDWPNGWYDRYIKHKYYRYDHIRQRMMATSQPFYWREVPPDPQHRSIVTKIEHEAAELGMCSGYCVPLYSSLFWQSALSLSSDHPKLTLGEDERAAINLMAVYANNSVIRIRTNTPSGSHLSEREREVLRWCKEGKSAWEIGIILSVSECTVKKHLTSIRSKYDVGTTLHAVVEGLRRQDISL